jgi:hypothetical protein
VISVGSSCLRYPKDISKSKEVKAVRDKLQPHGESSHGRGLLIFTNAMQLAGLLVLTHMRSSLHQTMLLQHCDFDSAEAGVVETQSQWDAAGSS